MKNRFLFLEFFYVLYLLSGFIKSFMIAFSFNSINFDITLVSAILLILYIVRIQYFIKFRNLKVYYKVILFLMLFLTWMLFSSFYTSSEAYWIHKYIYLFTNIVAFLLPIFTFKFFNIEKMFKIFIVISSIFNLIFVIKILPYIYVNELYYNIEGQYLMVSLLSGINILLIVILKIKYFNILDSLFFLFLNLLTIVSSGGRGGLLFMVLTIFLYFIIQFFKLKNFTAKKILKSISIFLMIVLVMAIFFQNYNFQNDKLIQRTIERMELLINPVSGMDAGKSIGTRIKYIDFSLEKSFHDTPHFLFGYGIGSFSVEYEGIDQRGYPHNIILEILFEMGLVGLFFFLLFYYSVIKYYRNNNIFWIVLFLSLLSLKSSNLTDLRLLFGFMSLMLIEAMHYKNLTRNN